MLEESRLGRLKEIMAHKSAPTGQCVKTQPSHTTEVSVLRSFGYVLYIHVYFIIGAPILHRTSYKSSYIESMRLKGHF